MSKEGSAAILFVCVAGGGLGGCASTITAYKNGPFKEQGFQQQALYTMTGERRFAFAVSKTDYALRFCAESLPEAASAFSGSTTASVEAASQGKVSLDDKSSSTLTQTFVRTEIAEVLRQLGFQACQAWAQGVLDDPTYRTQLIGLIDAGKEVMINRSKQALPSAPAAAPTPTPTPSPTPTPTPSPSPTSGGTPHG